MIAKIGRGKNLLGVILYNHDKVAEQKDNVLHTHKMIRPLLEENFIHHIQQEKE